MERRFRLGTALLTAWLLTLGVGCGRQAEGGPAVSGSAVPPAAPAVSGEAAMPAGATSAGADESQMAALLAELTQVVRKYGAEQRRVPKDLAELVAGGYLARVPEAPAGQAFKITPDLRVQLVGR